ncbi:hypothetical protein KPC_0454 [Acinetobacter stercoris]|uniref:Uncharacterized protein n=1 Tax=Acinetobacter stercoris TaxID=2126983 RepID=A0A2U3MV29_9GAMM|nr:hypothetical protein KPC_0454 [Acinetobacter stercoris]
MEQSNWTKEYAITVDFEILLACKKKMKKSGKIVYFLTENNN